MSSDVTVQKYRVVVIGAGPAGLSAAIEAAEKGASVCVLEHKEEPLKKLRITGNCRCNFSNTDIRAEHYHGDRSLLSAVLDRCSCDDLLDWMADQLGVEAVEVHYRYSENGYFYPSTNRAETVREAILQKCENLGIRLKMSFAVREITGNRTDGFLISGETAEGAETVLAGSVILATGSNAHPETGSDSSIYPVLVSLGVPFHTFLPALCAVHSKDPVLTELKGLRCDGEAALFDHTEETEYTGEPGEIQFNPHSVSGLPVMQLSGTCSEKLKQKHRLSLCLKIRKVNNKKGVAVPDELTLEVFGTDGFKTCQCCRGGVAAACVDPDTLQYRKVPGIYFAGELLDVDGECGGYNLHFAFASGIQAGRSAVL